MKQKYKICIIAWLAEFVVAYFLNKAKVQFRSLFIHAIGTLVFFLPIIVLFVLMSKDQGFSSKKRMLFKFIYVYIILCYVGGLVARLLLR